MVVRGPFEAFETLTVGASPATGFTAATAAQAVGAIISVETAAVRVRLDGTDPTAAIGHILEPGDTLELHSAHELLNAKFIRRDGTSATLRCSFSRKGHR